VLKIETIQQCIPNTDMQPSRCQAQLAWKCLFTPTFLGILTSKVYQTDRVFRLWTEFITRSVHARLQVCSLCYPG